MSTLKKISNWNIESLAEYVSSIVATESGNVFGKGQISMVHNRLKKRLIDLGDISANQYFDHLKKNYEKEIIHLVSILTTHHTFFFREFSHFEYLLSNLDTIISNLKKRGESTLRVLSAACSRGQEVYSLAMFFEYHLKKYPGINYSIVGTDIDPESVKFAKNGVYSYNEVKSIPSIYLNNHWQRGTGEISNFAKIKKELKVKCSFGTMNLLRPDVFLKKNKFDIIMCRNVFIYFDLKSIESIVKNFKKHLYKDALFITGLSESLKPINVSKQTLAPSVYCFDEIEKKKVEPKSKLTVSLPKANLIPKPIRMLIVDDSKSVLKLLNKIFTDDSSFEVVGTAENGVEAENFIKENEIDAMTLDIHMPEMDGVQYLEKNHSPNHPKVIVVSSASREDARYAQKTLNYGAIDFVEKPALNNLKEKAEEIKNKIKMSFLTQSNASQVSEKPFTKNYEIEELDKKARIFISNFSDKKKIKRTLNELQGMQPPTFIFFEGNLNLLEVIQDEIAGSREISVYDENTEIKINNVYLCDFKTHFEKVIKHIGEGRKSIGIFGIASNKVINSLVGLSNGQVLIEDTSEINQEVKEIASDIFPWTSFSHIGTEFLSGK